MSESGQARTEAESLVREWDKHDGDRIVRDMTEDYFAVLEEFKALGRKLAKGRE